MTIATPSGSDIDRPTVDRLLTTTRSVRRRLDLVRPVAPELIDECLALALQAPNESDAQRWRFVVVTDVDVRRQMGDVYRRSSAQYLEHLRRSNPDLDEAAPSFRSSQWLWDHLGEVPVHVVPCFQLDDVQRTSTQHAYVNACVYGSIFPAMWSFQLACRSRGLGTCFVTSVLKFEQDCREILRLPHDFVIGGLVVVAHTVGSFSAAARLPLDVVRRFDRWS